MSGKLKEYITQNLPQQTRLPISEKSMLLLMRSELSIPVLPHGVQTQTSLLTDLALAADPAQALHPDLLANIIVKFFHAYVHEGSYSITLDEHDISHLFDQFTNRRLGAFSLKGKDDLRRFLLDHGFALSMLLDIPKTVHILLDICLRPLPHVRNNQFHGLDIGSGTGILMLGQWILAHRNGAKRVEITGIERSKDVCNHSAALLQALEIGTVVQADAKAAATYQKVCTAPIDFISNETLPSLGHSVWKEDYVQINETLFSVVPDKLKATSFFPHAFVAIDRKGEQQIRLDISNEFHKYTDYPLKLMKAFGIEFADGAQLRLDEIGSDYSHLVSSFWLPHLAHRW